MKKRVSGDWVSIPYRKYGTDTDVITSFPTNIIGDGTNATAVIKGNMVQSGTPTAASPVYPSECGDLVQSGEHTGQYEIPISLGNTTASIYTTNPIRKIDGITSPIDRTTGGTDDISSNGTLTRRIIKVELDGSEGEWRKGGGDGDMAFFVNNAVLNGAAGSPILCSHFSVGNVGATTTDIGIFIGSTGTNLRIRPENVASTELTDFTTWLSNQKTGGTPVTIYYVAATSTTEQLTVPTLPTTGAVEQFDVDTTLAPSEVDLTYHGWHNKTDKEYTSGEWN